METRLSKHMRERSPLWSVMIDHEDLASLIFSWFSGNDFKFLSSVNRESRRVLFKRRVVPKRFRSERFETASTIDFALDHGLKMDGALLCKAVEAGNVELLKYLHLELKVPLHPNVISLAAQSGNVNMMEWLLGHGRRIYLDTLHYAVKSDSLGMIQFLCEYYTLAEEALLFMSEITPAASKNGLRMLQYLCARGLNLKESALPYYASKYGRIDMLKYVKENALCEWNARECLEFTRSARFEALEEKRKKKRKTKIDEFLMQRLSQTIEWLETQIRDGHDGVTHLFQ